eukprot:TRINITY_DN12630_c0_g1_i1.p1 TRINITY_DN12630_c0_g1~~TRINITY_DN12630_c0_g1_i1.p1  ORF type:complete len:309 (-),score=57.05 TRINITY_DN12630_c0_g1_i1:13-939(-)
MSGNFRNNYYNTLGMPSGSPIGGVPAGVLPPTTVSSLSTAATPTGPVLELESLLVQDVVNLTALRFAVLNSPVPARLRPLVWKIFLGVYGPNRSAWESIQEFKQQEYSDLKRTATMLSVISSETDRSTTLVQVFHLFQEIKQRPFVVEQDALLVCVSVVLNAMPESPEADHFFLLERLVTQSLQLQNHQNMVVQRCAGVQQVLLTHDRDLLFSLQRSGISFQQFCSLWFRTFFVDIFPQSVLARIFDNVVAAGDRFLVLTAGAILIECKPKMVALSLHDVSRFLSALPALNADRVLRRAALLTSSSSH